jgi:hypothetical protein
MVMLAVSLFHVQHLVNLVDIAAKLGQVHGRMAILASTTLLNLLTQSHEHQLSVHGVRDGSEERPCTF